MGGKPVRLTPGARDELLRAVDYYDEQAALGPDLLAEVRACLDRIAEAPESYPAESGFGEESVRVAPTKRFLYRVVFVEEPDEIRVLAIRHVRQRPGYWQPKRLTEGE